MRSFGTLFLTFLLAAAANAQTPGSCDIGRATGTLDASDVRATFPTTGALFYGPDAQAQYTTPQATGISPVYLASVWIGGTVNGDFRVAGATYGQGLPDNANFEFWPGPLDDGATLPTPTDCSAYDRVWVVSRRDLDAYDAGAAPTTDLADWPVGLGAPAVDASGAPLAATPRDRTLDLGAGERPVIYGTQAAFWIMNDVGGAHRTTGSAPLGIEVGVTAFVIESETLALHQSSFLRYTVTNRNTADIEDLRMAMYADTDLGFAGDDYVGADVDRSMGYTYNANEFEGYGYGPHPPALGIDILGGDATRDPAMTAFLSYSGGDANRGDPQNALQYARTFDGLWGDGTPITANGNGYRQGGETTTFLFPGDPVTQSFWSEEDTGRGRSDLQDRRMVVATQLGRLASGETSVLDVGFIYALGTDRLNSITALRAASDEIQQRYDAGTLVAPAALPTGTIATAPALVFPDQGVSTADTVSLAWQDVAGATDYLYQTSESPSFEDDFTFRTETLNTLSATGTFARYAQRPFEGLDLTIYWRVRARRGAAVGPWSESRSFRYTRPPSIPDVYVVEIIGPGGADPCGPDATSTAGCPPSGSPLIPTAPGNIVYDLSSRTGAYNGTGAYAMTALPDPFSGSPTSLVGSPSSLAQFAPNDFEIRIVPEDEGSYGYYRFETGRLIRVPFQIWDIGVVTPGEPNDPADDIQMIPVLFADAGTEAADECVFQFNGPSPFNIQGSGLATQRIYAYYPIDDDYSAFETLAASIVDADANGCPRGSTTTPAANRIDVDRGRPIQRDVLVQVGATTTVADLEGTVIRYYTREGSTPAEPEPAVADGLALAPPVPNPSASVARLRYRTAQPGEAVLSVVDLLGRRVMVLPQGDRSPGEHGTEVDVSRLSAGVYVVVLEAGGQRRSQMLTVIR